MNTNLVPPYDHKVEQAVLGSILLNNRALAVVGKFITEEDFYVEANRMIFVAMNDIARMGKPIDTVTVGTHMMNTGQLDKVGGAMVFDNITKSTATVANVEHYAKMVKEFSARRKMIYTAQQIVADGFSGKEETEKYLVKSRRQIVTAANSMQFRQGPQHIDDDLLEVYKELETGEPPKGIVKTGFDIVDRTTGGLWPGLVTIIAGRPSMGKSTFVLNIASNVALHQGLKVLYFTLEDLRKTQVTRMLARYADIDLTDLMLRRVRSKDQWARLTEACNRLSGKKPIWIEDASGLSAAQITQLVMYHQEVHGLDLIIIDHLSEIREQGENETMRVTNAARAVRDGAKEIGIPVLLASQLNRALENRPSKVPTLSDLRQSGEIEQIARMVWFLHRPGYYLPDGDLRKDLQLIVAKANHGKTGMLRMWTDLSRMYMTSWDVPEHGLWPGDEGKGASVTEARENSRERSRKGQGDFFTGGGVHVPDEKDY